MSTIITPSWFGSYGQCPFRRKNSVYDANPLNTIHGALANAAAAAAVTSTKNILAPWIRYYDKHINPMLEKRKQLRPEVLKEWMAGVFRYIKQYANDNWQLRQEQKLEYPYDPENWIWFSGTPDVIAFKNNPTEEDSVVCEVIDMKCGTISWYDSPEVWRENAQWFFYPRFIFKQRDQEILTKTLDWKTTPKVKFTFLVMDKKSGKVEPFSKVLDEAIVKTNIDHGVKEYLKLINSDKNKTEYPAKQCRACGFCPVADICPLKKVDLNVEEEVDDLF